MCKLPACAIHGHLTVHDPRKLQHALHCDSNPKAIGQFSCFCEEKCGRDTAEKVEYLWKESVHSKILESFSQVLGFRVRGLGFIGLRSFGSCALFRYENLKLCRL